MDLSPAIKAVQQKLGLTADGIAGPLTWAAISKSVGVEESTTDSVVNGSKLVDPRSEGNIATLRPIVQSLARDFLKLLKSNNIEAKVISGARTYDEQNKLYEQGRTSPGNVVTNARAGYSNHNFALAFDIGIFEDGKYREESPLYKKAGDLGKSLGLLWGGDWHSSDEPHFEFRPKWARDMTESQALAEYRQRNSDGISIV